MNILIFFLKIPQFPSELINDKKYKLCLHIPQIILWCSNLVYAFKLDKNPSYILQNITIYGF